MRKKGLQVPTVPKQLEKHVTLATYMAAFHLSQLMEKAAVTWGKDKERLCDLDRVAYFYNGGAAYPPAVLGKKMKLCAYLSRVRRTAGPKKKEAPTLAGLRTGHQLPARTGPP